MIGDKRCTEALDAAVLLLFGRGAFWRQRSLKVTDDGVSRREDADISNDKAS
jgi:hypothetical protein